MTAKPTAHRPGWSQCPHCGALHDAASDMGTGRGPKAGDCSICIECGGLSTFEVDGSRRKPTPAEYDEFLADPGVALMIAAWARSDARGWQ